MLPALRAVHAALAVAAMCSSVVAQAPRQEKALTRPENWGLTFGLEGIAPTFDPRQDQPYGFKTRGAGPSLNAGVVFLRHFLFGGEIGSVFFGGDRSFMTERGSVPAQTTNSVVSTAYYGLITSPMGPSPGMGRKWWLGVLGGTSNWSGERRMEGCVTCLTDRIKMRSGAFIEPFVMFGGGDTDGGGGFRLGYRQYLRSSRTIQSVVTFGAFFDLIKL